MTITVPFNLPDGSTVNVRIAQLYVRRGEGMAVVNVAVTDDPAGQAIVDSIFSSVRQA